MTLPELNPAAQASTKNKPCVVFNKVSKSFGTHNILNKLSFVLHEKESLAILGPSGTGKSVMLKLLIGLLKPNSGSISVLGYQLSKDIALLHNSLADRVGMIFQNAALFDSLSVWENVGFVDLQRKISRNVTRDKVQHLLLEVGLPVDVMDQFPSSLSGGMRKRVGIARAIAQKPQLLLCDEPTAGLDPVIGAHIGKLIASTVSRYQTACITITHDIHLAETVADNVALLYGGNFVWNGTASQIATSKNRYIHQFRNGLAEGPIQQITQRG